ncbi:MAG: ferritin-like domain-containing protein [Caldilineaceae bacterium]
MNMSMTVNELFDFALSRRHYVAGSLAGGVAALATPLGLGRAFAQGLSDIDILQFALTLEHLEARMYRDMLATNILTGKEMQYFQSFGAHEAAHVDALTSALSAAGADPVQPLDSYNFPAFNNRGDILNFARTAEELGVGAYQARRRQSPMLTIWPRPAASCRWKPATRRLYGFSSVLPQPRRR